MLQSDLNVTENTLSSIAEEILHSIVENRTSLQYWVSMPHIVEILHWGYNNLVKVKGVQPIESIETNAKHEFWAEVKELDVSIEEKIKAAKSLYFLSYVAGKKLVNN